MPNHIYQIKAPHFFKHIHTEYFRCINQYWISFGTTKNVDFTDSLLVFSPGIYTTIRNTTAREATTTSSWAPWNPRRTSRQYAVHRVQGLLSGFRMMPRGVGLSTAAANNSSLGLAKKLTKICLGKKKVSPCVWGSKKRPSLYVGVE